MMNSHIKIDDSVFLYLMNDYKVCELHLFLFRFFPNAIHVYLLDFKALQIFSLPAQKSIELLLSL